MREVGMVLMVSLYVFGLGAAGFVAGGLAAGPLGAFVGAMAGTVTGTLCGLADWSPRR